MRLAFLFIMIGLSGCGEYCPMGEVCDRSCPPGTSGLCGPSDLCLCANQHNDVSQVDALCRSARPGDLRITEVLIDGEPTEDGEFVEVINTSTEPISLGGLALLSTRGGKLVKRVLFLTGCIPGGAALAMFGAESRWIWSQKPEVEPTVDMGAFGFSNSAPFQFVLHSQDGEQLDLVMGDPEQIKAGVSLARQLSAPEEPLVLHTTIAAGRRSSPGTCPNGSSYQSGCLETEERSCRSPEIGHLIINEVLIDGKDTEKEEFVELVNATDHSVSLAGIQLLSNRGQGLATRIHFLDGCIPPRGAVAIYEGRERWVWRPAVNEDVEFESMRFGFPNAADFNFVLQDHSGRQIDRISGAAQLIRPGVSVNRRPDVFGRAVVQHTELDTSLSSPGVCANGRSFQSACLYTAGIADAVVLRLIAGLPWADLIEAD